MPAAWLLPEYLERKLALTDAYRAQLSDPEAAPVPLRATVQVAAGTGVRMARIREHTVVTDAGAALGGYGLGPTAPELLLAALASCLAHSALLVAADHHIPLEQLEVEVTGQIDYRGTLAVSDTAPIPPTNIAYTLRFGGTISDEAVARIETDVARLCPVLLALTRPTSVSGRAERM